jgi:hypothetical protein
VRGNGTGADPLRPPDPGRDVPDAASEVIVRYLGDRGVVDGGADRGTNAPELQSVDSRSGTNRSGPPPVLKDHRGRTVPPDQLKPSVIRPDGEDVLSSVAVVATGQRNVAALD